MKKLVSLFMFVLLGSGFFLGMAKTAAAQDGDQDPPTRVARLNYIQGSVSFQPSGEQDWVAADPNRPLTTGDNLWADQNSRGEVHIGSTSIRLASQTGISFLNLDDRTVQLQLAQGEIEIHLRRLEPGNAFEVDTPNLAFTLTQAGEYVVQADPDGSSTVITVREGSGEVTGAGESYELVPGQQYAFTGTDQLTFDSQAAQGFDDLENWSEMRDDRENRSASARYVSRDIDGYYDLDDNGDWQTDPDYGAIWVPRNVVVGWAPYQVGHWVWIAPWGWTWVDAQPWGFAPFHYGRWAYVRGYWGWVPGPIVVRPVYAPALVAFVGGGGFGVSVGFGGGFNGVAWFPLGPRDVFVPGYRCSARYWQNVNVTNSRVVNVTQVTNVYNTYRVNNVTNVTNVTNVNRTVNVTNIHYTYENNAAAVTAVSRETFVNARPVQTGTVRVTPEQLTTARVTESAPLQPTRSSYVASTARVTPVAAQPKVAFTDRKVVAKLAPPVPPASHAAAPRIVNAETPSRAPNAPMNEVNRNMNQTRETTLANPAPAATTPAVRETNQSPAGAAAAAQAEREANTAPAAKPRVYEQQNVPADHPVTEENRSDNDRNAQQNNHLATQTREQDNRRAEQQHPAVKFAPPAKANDQMYDVHPPLNQRPAAAPAPAPAPKPAPKPQPPPKSESKPK